MDKKQHSLFYKNLKELLMDKNISIDSIQKQYDLSVGYFSRETYLPALKMFVDIAKTLDTTIEDLLEKPLWKEVKLKISNQK